MNRIRLTAILVIAAVIFSILLHRFDNAPIALKKDTVILAFGDSITYGYGVKEEFSYPSVLSKKTGLHVINAGVPGEVSSEGLVRLPGLLESKPDVVILCHGGNDILRKLSRENLKKNLLSMIKMIRQSGAKVLLVGVPDFGVFGLKTAAIYTELADETGVIYEKDILSVVESDRRFKSDYIHPNEKGYEMMADAFKKRLFAE